MQEFQLFLQSVLLDFRIVGGYIIFSKTFLAFLIGVITSSLSIALFAARHPHTVGTIVHHETSEAFETITPHLHDGTYLGSFSYFKIVYKTVQLFLAIAASALIILSIVLVLFYG